MNNTDVPAVPVCEAGPTTTRPWEVSRGEVGASERLAGAFGFSRSSNVFRGRCQTYRMLLGNLTNKALDAFIKCSDVLLYFLNI